MITQDEALSVYLEEVRKIVGDQAEVRGQIFDQENRWEVKAFLGEFKPLVFDCPKGQMPSSHDLALMVLDWAEASDG